MTNTELETCINKYGKDIYSFCRHLTCNVQEADDLYQDTFLKSMELDDELDFDDNPKSYLLSIALRIWRNRKRKFAWRRRITEERIVTEERMENEWESMDSPEERLLRKEEYMSVRKAVTKLPERQKVIVLLYYMEEMSVAQIAAIANIPVGTVKSRLHQARITLKKELEDI
ncbi:MAG: RNA polymerase sigma factor [Roseburia sp.]|nr:RNA polymerase sigma factor [Roseburia sp.]